MAQTRPAAAGEAGTFLITYRTVRGAYLCGVDPLTGSNFDHRREWFTDRLRMLQPCFAIDVLGYALKNKTSELLVKVDPQRVDTWDDNQVWQRWLATRANAENALPPLPDPARVQLLRERLGSLSWFMKSLNEVIARRANREDGCTGHFWEPRSRKRRLNDLAAVASAMADADLKPWLDSGGNSHFRPWVSVSSCADESATEKRARQSNEQRQSHLPQATQNL